MQISNTGINLIRTFEGCSLKAYQCPAKVWTIGYGETGTFALTGQKIQKGLTITQEQADKSFILGLTKYGYIEAVNNLGVKLNQNQFDALVSFDYNLGIYIFKGSLLKSIKEEDWQSVASQMLLYNRGGGRVLEGLVRRRKAEVELLLKPISVQDDIELFEAVRKLIKKGINIDFNSWKRLDLIELNNVPILLNRLGGVSKLNKMGILNNVDLWVNKKYTKENVRSLLIKCASKL